MIYDCLIHEKLNCTDEIKGDVVSLKLQGFYHAEGVHDLPNYSFFIMLANLRIGCITLRLGYNETTEIHGHIGYTIDEGYRGHGYSYYALELILRLAKDHGYSNLLVTCDPNNISSIKSVMKIGGILLKENVIVPKDHIYYVLGIKHLNQYQIPIS